ncbi:MAG: hypothetical protein J6Y91_04540 [Alphaproteobacteria bacterium]|nr:hypothetical protein [Alphaproteobacteria bacterium]
MNVSTIAIAFIGLLIFFAAIKFLLKLPFYIMTFAILGGIGYVAFQALRPALGM